MPRASRIRGFSLLEMVVTMGIFAILVALGVPAMRTWVSNAKVRGVADSLQNGVRLAQSESLRRSRQVVFSLTTSQNPQGAGTFTAAAAGNNWTVNTVPALTGETSAFIDAGVLTADSASVQITNAPAAICFNSVGRLTLNTTSVPAVTNGATCTLPTAAPPGSPAGTPPAWSYDVSAAGADHPLRVEVFLGGQVHLCDLSKTLSASNPDGC